MSYIRSGSNPEKLYIWGDDGGNVYISQGHNAENIIPTSIFHGLIRNWHRNSGEEANFRGAKIRDVLVKCNGKNESKTELSYKGWKYTMWYVTWSYIAYTNLHNVNRDVKRKIIIK